MKSFRIEITDYDEIIRFNLTDYVSKEMLEKYNVYSYFAKSVRDGYFTEALEINYPNHCEIIELGSHNLFDINYILENYRDRIIWEEESELF